MNREEALKELTEYDINELILREAYNNNITDNFSDFIAAAAGIPSSYIFNSSISTLFDDFYQFNDYDPERLTDALHALSGSMLDNSLHYSNEGYSLSENKKVSIVKHSRYGYNTFHDHEFFEIAYLFSGSCNHKFVINGDIKTTTLNQGDLVIIPPGLVHNIEIFDDSLMVNILIHKQTFQSAFLSQLPSNTTLYKFFSDVLFSDEEQSFIVIQNNSEHLGEIILDLYIEEQKHDAYSAKISEQLISIFFLEVLRSNQNTLTLSDKISESDKLLASMLLYIENNFTHITLNDVADNFHFSKTYINKIFKKAMGTTILKYIKDLRLKEANKLLPDMSLTISHIGELVGYNDTSYFIEEYKKAFGITPKAYRELHYKSE